MYYFKDLLNNLLNYFLVLDNFFYEFFFYTGFLNLKNIVIINNYNIKLFNNFSNFKLLNNLFNLYINNYYLADFFLQNSRIMSYCSLKKYIIYK